MAFLVVGLIIAMTTILCSRPAPLTEYEQLLVGTWRTQTTAGAFDNIRFLEDRGVMFQRAGESEFTTSEVTWSADESEVRISRELSVSAVTNNLLIGRQPFYRVTWRHAFEHGEAPRPDLDTANSKAASDLIAFDFQLDAP